MIYTALNLNNNLGWNSSFHNLQVKLILGKGGEVSGSDACLEIYNFYNQDFKEHESS